MQENPKSADHFNVYNGTMPKALWTQALTALTSNLGLVGLVQYGWQVWFGKFGLVGLVWYVWFGSFGLVVLVWYVWFGTFGLVHLVW